jgi:hypothetical protein
MLTETPQLQYAKDWPRWFRRRGPRRVLIACTLAIAIGGISWAWNSTPGEWARFRYYQYRCEHYSAPAEQVVFAPVGNDPLSTWRSAGMPLNAPEWKRLNRYIGLSDAICPLAFLHDRQTPGGAHRLVAVELTPMCSAGPPNGDTYIPMLAVTLIVVTPSDELPSSPAAGRAVVYGLGPIKGKLVIFAGQPDPSDPTHFTIGYRVDDIPGVMDAHLRDDDTVAFRFISGPLAQPPVQNGTAFFPPGEPFDPKVNPFRPAR